MVPEIKCSKCTLVPEFLKEQLALLSEKSKAKDISVTDLVNLTDTMSRLVTAFSDL